MLRPWQNLTLDSCVTLINRMRLVSGVLLYAIVILRALLFGVCIYTLWAVLQPTAQTTRILLGLLATGVVLLLTERQHRKMINKTDFLILLSMRYSQLHPPPFALKDPAEEQAALLHWRPVLWTECRNFLRDELARMTRQFGALSMPAIICILLGTYQPQVLADAVKGVKLAVARLSRNAQLKVIEGSVANHDKEDIYSLSSSSVKKIELLAQNMVEITVNGLTAGEAAPRVDLVKKETAPNADKAKKIYQSFQLSAVKGQNEDGLLSYNQAFSVNEDVEIYVSTVSEKAPVADVFLRQLPIPKVRLEAQAAYTEPWPDERPFGLKIQVHAENPLAQVKLQIRTGGKVFQELVTNVMNDDLKDINTTYSLTLEPYNQEDISQVEIEAVAIDKAVPQPLVGKSQPLVLRIASAYGRYRQSLSSLKEIKAALDDEIQKKDAKISKEMLEQFDKAMQQAEMSPFFDGLDRMNLMRMQQELLDQQMAPDLIAKIDAIEDLNNFLFEHETLDDRERDRDFFVAVRAFSRMMEGASREKKAQLGSVGDRLLQFLNERHDRWEKRVARIPNEARPPLWQSSVKDKPFHRGIEQVKESLFAGVDKKERDPQVILAKTASSYKTWIDELEAKEDQARQDQERKRQEGLANAQNTLRELQRRQATVSNALDKAATQTLEQLADKWPAARMEQNTNIEEGGRFEAELRSLSPAASQRMKAALDAMKIAVGNGNDRKFTEAETAADAAGRLLRQAESDANKSRQQQQGKGRGRRRQVAGDNSYGNPPLATQGDIEIKREYQVNRRYREDILDEVRAYQQREMSDDDKAMMDEYLRRVVR